MVGIEFEEGNYGLRAVLRTSWSDEVESIIQERQCPELEINHAKGWTGRDLSFLHSCSWLKALKVIDFTITSVEPIHELHQLRALEVMTYCRTALRFSAFPSLEQCALEWRPKADSLFDCTTLRRLFVNRYSGRDLWCFSRLVNLEFLAVLNAPIESLEGIAPLKKLHSVRLANLKNLRSLVGIDALTDLEELEIHTCQKISAIDEIANLPKLRKLHLNNDGKIASLKPLDKLTNLESVIFYESTNILDGDLSPLFRQKHLSHVAFQNRRHYSHKREEFGSAYFQ